MIRNKNYELLTCKPNMSVFATVYNSDSILEEVSFLEGGELILFFFLEKLSFIVLVYNF